MKEWITPVLVIVGLIVVGFGIRAIILKRSTNPQAANGTAGAVGSAPGGGAESGNGPELTPPEAREPREDPEQPNNWHDEHHPFIGYPPETAPVADIKITTPRDQAEHPLDDMVTIPAGEFTMGSADIPWAAPERKVNLGAYRIDRYEVTNGAYQKFIKDTGHRQPELRDEWAKDYSWREQTFPKGMANRPVTLVSLEDARAYCRWQGKRLPTEEEWEKAARGAKGNKWPWGNAWDGRKAHTVERFSGPLANLADWKRFEASFDEDAEIHAWPVGSYAGDKSPFGVMDMHGNVSEWVDSAFDPYEGGETSAHPLLGKKDTIVVRGNSFANRDYAAPAAVRYPFPATYVEDTIGFRCAADI